MVGIAIIGLQFGEPSRLVYASDYNGKTCGGPSSPGSTLNGCSGGSCKHVYYPRLSEDLLLAAAGGIDTSNVLSIPLTGVCLPKCPVFKDVVCLYDYEDQNGRPTYTTLATTCRTLSGRFSNKDMCSSCWTVDLNTESVLYRCLWVKEVSQTIVERCTSPNSTTDTTDPSYVDPNSKSCATKETVTTNREEAPASQDVLVDQLASFAAVFSTSLSDISSAKWVIVASGGAAAVLIGWTFILLMRVVAPCVVWSIVVLILTGSTLITAYCAFSASIITLPESLANTTSTVSLAQYDSITTKQWEIATYVWAAITILLFAIIIALRKRIRQAIALIVEASKAIQRLKFLLVFPLPLVLVISLVYTYWVVVAAFIASADAITLGQTQQSASTIVATIDGVSVNATVAGVGADDDIRKGLFAYHFFGALWTAAFVEAFGITCIAGAVANWYFTRPNADSGKKDLGRFPILKSISRVIRNHLGSLAFGSLLVAIVQFLRSVLGYIDAQTKAWQNGNRFIRVMFKVIACVLWIFEKCLKFITRNAYIIIATDGASFCPAASRAFFLILNNIALIGTTNVISFFVMILGKIVITFLAAAVAVAWFFLDSSFQRGGSNELSGFAVPMLVVILLAYAVAAMFMGVYDLTIDSLLVCFCIDVERYEATPERLYAPRSLRATLGISGDIPKKSAGEDDVEAKAEAPAQGAPTAGKVEQAELDDVDESELL